MLSFKKKIELYAKMFGDIPEDYEERMGLLLQTLKFKEKELPFIEKVHKKLTNIKTEKLRFILYMVPDPTPRPRTRFASRRFYVTDAKNNNDLFKEILKSIEQIPIITTACKITVHNYLPTPSGMNRTERFFAELEMIRATSTPDWDNLAKAYCDMVQKNLLLNDSLIWCGTSIKHYSIKPRIDLTFEYDSAYDCTFNRRKVESSKYYNETDETKFDQCLKTILKLK